MAKLTKIFLWFLLFVPLISSGQSFNTDRIELANFLKRMYNSAPFDGVRVVEDYNACYLISVISLENAKYGSDSAMNRVASVKAMSETSRYLNGSEISSDLIIQTNTNNRGYSHTEISENIRENSIGYVRELELLTSFSAEQGWKTYIFCKQMDMPQKQEVITKKAKGKRNKKQD